MMAKMDAEEADVVYGLRISRAGETIGKKLSAALFYRTLDRLTDIEIPVDTGDFRLMSRRALDALLSLPEQARFIRGMVAWIGFRQVPFPYHRAERHAGETHYPLSKMIRLAFDAVTGFSTAPLRLATQLGMLLAGLAVLFGLYILVVWLRGGTVQGWTSLALLVIGLGAAQMFVLGLIGEYLGRVYVEAKGRPLYIISDVIGTARPGARLGYRGDRKTDVTLSAERMPDGGAAGPTPARLP
jgi:dolichol-phosphate mannosyltransferase